ncbi:Hsp20/alpha crystallin family protein [Haladaptatus sp. NG-SE-30]
MERYTPFEEMDRMFDQMRSRMGGLGESRPFGSRETHMNLSERDGEFVLAADLPGFEKDEIELSFYDGVLTVSANHEVTGDEFARSRKVSERVTLPKTVEKEKITASYRNGVLEVRLPIEEEAEAENHIEISD